MKQTIAKVQSNIGGSLIGGVAGYLVAKNVVKTDKMWTTALVVALGVIAGAMVQSNMKAKASMPTPATTK
jgi:hypothetical protein